MKFWNLYILFLFEVAVIEVGGEGSRKGELDIEFFADITGHQVYNFGLTRRNGKELEVAAGHICRACSSIGW